MKAFLSFTAMFIGLAVTACAHAQSNEPSTAGWATPTAVARAFQQACVLTGAEEPASVDWALSQGFEPADALRGNVDELLAGKPGSVLAAPGTQSRVLLAVAPGRHCTVWAERVSGPALRLAVMESLQSLTASAGRLELQVDRSIERAGAWRNQMQWRFRATGGTGYLGLGAITTLSDAPATQALHAAPMAATPAYAPDGMPMR